MESLSHVTKKKRRPNFTDAEKMSLVEGVTNDYDLLVGKLTTTLTDETKDSIWKKILSKVNAIGGHERTISEIKKKYQTIKCEVKRTEADNRREIRKTGGGDAVVQSHDSINSKVLSHISNQMIEGISNGIDVYSLNQDDPFQEGHSQGARYLDSQNLAQSNDEDQTDTVLFKQVRTNVEETNVSKEDGGRTSKKKKKSPQSTLYFLQNKQVTLLEQQVGQMKRIGDLLEERNGLEKDKIVLKKRKLEILQNEF